MLKAGVRAESARRGEEGKPAAGQDLPPPGSAALATVQSPVVLTAASARDHSVVFFPSIRPFQEI